MAFWYSGTEDRTGAWHWIGIAISLSQTLGLHRNPEPSNASHRFLKGRSSILRRMWWSCFARDRWLSLAMGRPMRINLEDCETPMPCAEDVTKEVGLIPQSTKDKYLPTHTDRLACLWIQLLKISDILGTIIRIFYSTQRNKPNGTDMQRYEHEILQCALSDEEKGYEDSICLLHAHQLRLFYE